MKKICILFLFLVGRLYAQPDFSNLSFSQAQKQARIENKILALFILAEDCECCNESLSRAFHVDPTAKAAYDKACISLRIEPNTPAFKEIDSLYTIRNSFGVLYLSGDGYVLNRYRGSSTLGSMYLPPLDEAIKKNAFPDSNYIRAERSWASGDHSLPVLYNLVYKRQQLGINTDELTEELIEKAGADSAKSISFLQLIARQSPIIGSNTEKYMYQNPSVFQTAWYLLPLQERTAINTTIQAKSMQKAIRDKDRESAQKIALATGRTYAEQSAAAIAISSSMLNFYKGIKDTADLLDLAVDYYDRYWMTISVDSVLQVDSLNMIRALKQATPYPRSSVPMETGKIQMKRIVFAPSAQRYARELNNGAWTLLQFTHDSTYLHKACTWITRALLFFEDPTYYDTYAQLLYNTGNRKDAIIQEEKAINLQIARKIPGTEFSKTLEKMKANLPDLTAPR
ncbi:MAG TPA: hypothetical protein VG842_04730 [Sediminibacterium sp.]|nr:hypothetical protein [Sediminibacterium sp.]